MQFPDPRSRAVNLLAISPSLWSMSADVAISDRFHVGGVHCVLFPIGAATQRAIRAGVCAQKASILTSAQQSCGHAVCLSA